MQMLNNHFCVFMHVYLFKIMYHCLFPACQMPELLSKACSFFLFKVWLKLLGTYGYFDMIALQGHPPLVRNDQHLTGESEKERSSDT